MIIPNIWENKKWQPNHQPDLWSLGLQLWPIPDSGWWFEPLWKIWKSIGMIIPNIWENRKCSKPPTRSIFINYRYITPPEIRKLRGPTLWGWVYWMPEGFSQMPSNQRSKIQMPQNIYLYTHNLDWFIHICKLSAISISHSQPLIDYPTVSSVQYPCFFPPYLLIIQNHHVGTHDCIWIIYKDVYQLDMDNNSYP